MVESAADETASAALPPTLGGVADPQSGQLQRRATEAGRDRALVARALAGEERAFAALVERYGQPILSLCFASTLDAAEAEDLSQEIFVAVWRNLGRFRGESSI